MFRDNQDETTSHLIDALQIARLRSSCGHDLPAESLRSALHLFAGHQLVRPNVDVAVRSLVGRQSRVSRSSVDRTEMAVRDVRTGERIPLVHDALRQREDALRQREEALRQRDDALRRRSEERKAHEAALARIAELEARLNR